MQLRPYQTDLLRTSLEYYQAGITRQLLTLPTGMGKAVCLANMKSHHGLKGRTLVIVNREELATQAAEKMAVWNPGMSIGIDMGDRKATKDETIVAGIQTLAVSKHRLERLDPSEFGLVIVDECHYSVADSYKKVFSHFGLLREQGKSPILLAGYTATTQRGDQRPLGEIYDAVVYEYPLRRAIEEGWLVGLHGIQIKTGTDISKVGVSKGEFKQDELADAVNTPVRNELIVKAWIEYAWPRQTVAFCTDVAHAKALRDVFVRNGVRAEAIWSDDPQRRAKLAAFRTGDVDVVVNVAILIEGYDYWGVECILLAAPTKSPSRMVQQIGRGTRLEEGVNNLVEWKSANPDKQVKEACLILDCVDNTGKHSLVTLPSIFGMSKDLDLQGQNVVAALKAIEDAQFKYPNADLSKLENINDLEVFAQAANLWQVRFATEVQGFSELQWVRRGDGSYRILLPKNEYFRIEEDLVGKFTVEGRLKEKKYQPKKLASLADAVKLVEQTITTNAPEHLILLGREATWMKGRVTGPQLEQLKKLKVPDSQIVMWNRGQAAAYITSRFNKN